MWPFSGRTKSVTEDKNLAGGGHFLASFSGTMISSFFVCGREPRLPFLLSAAAGSTLSMTTLSGDELSSSMWECMSNLLSQMFF